MLKNQLLYSLYMLIAGFLLFPTLVNASNDERNAAEYTIHNEFGLRDVDVTIKIMHAGATYSTVTFTRGDKISSKMPVNSESGDKVLFIFNDKKTGKEDVVEWSLPYGSLLAVLKPHPVVFEKSIYISLQHTGAGIFPNSGKRAWRFLINADY